MTSKKRRKNPESIPPMKSLMRINHWQERKRAAKIRSNPMKNLLMRMRHWHGQRKRVPKMVRRPNPMKTLTTKRVMMNIFIHQESYTTLYQRVKEGGQAEIKKYPNLMMMKNLVKMTSNWKGLRNYSVEKFSKSVVKIYQPSCIPIGKREACLKNI